MYCTSDEFHLKNDQIFCKIKKNKYIFNYCMVKFSHVATLLELSNKNLKKDEKSRISNIWNKIYGTSYDFHLKNDQIFCKIKKNIYIYIYI